MKKTALGAVAIWFGMLGLGLGGCNLGGSKNGTDVVWLTGDVPGESTANSGDGGAQDVGGEVSRGEDVRLDETAPKAEIAADVSETAPCVPDCEERDCGPDGCGGLCGPCQKPNKCNVYGKCIYKSPDCTYCVEPFPACVQINSIWSCVGCEDDSDCPQGIQCHTALYTCRGSPPVEIPKCDAETPCKASDEIVLDLACELDSGLCYDRFGWCDWLSYRCRPGSWCIYSIEALIPVLGETPDIYPPGGGPETVGLCSCQNPVDITELLPCMRDKTEPCPPSPECPGTQVCLATPEAVSKCPYPSTAPGVCVDISKIKGNM